MRCLLLSGVMAAGLAAPAHATTSEPKWFVRAGVTALDLRDKVKLSAAGTDVPGSALHTKIHFTPSVQVGRFLTEHFALAATVGIPPHIKIYGRGTLEPYGKLAETTYGPSCVTLQYHPLREGPVRPYIGAGLSYMIIFSAKDAAFKNVKIQDDVSPALEAGTDVMLGKHYGFFLDFKKAFLRTTATGTFGPAPIVGKVKLDPLVFSTGVTFHF
jgi:outer membrane protein